MHSLLHTIRQFLSELRRRNVYQVAIAYLAAGFVVVELADIAAGTFDLPGWFGPMVWVVVGLGFPIAIVLAWALEVTPEGVRVEEPEASGEVAQGPESFSFTSNGVIVGLLVLVAGLFLYPMVFSSQEGTKGQATAPDTAQIDERSIAVLPFEPLSSGEKTETFAQGVHDDLLTRLSNISDLTVISRTSVEKYRNTDLSLPAIADSLGVRWVMEGGVLESGGQIQVNAQLIDPKSDAHVWADDYQRKLTAENLFAIQGEITGEIANALKAKLTVEERQRANHQPTENLDAYRLFVRARSLLDQRTGEAMRKAIGDLRQAIQQDSLFAPAWAALGEAHGLLAGYGHAPLDSVGPIARETIRRALTLDSTLADAHASAGLLHLYERNGPAALRELNTALRLRPSLARAHRWLGVQLSVLGRAGAMKHYRRAVELNPMSPEGHADLAGELLFERRYSEALRHARRATGIEPTYGLGRRMEVHALYRLGRLREARSLLQSDTVRGGYNSPRRLRALIHIAAGDTTGAREMLARLRELGDTYSVGLVNAALGREDAAFDAFQNVEQWDVGKTIVFRHNSVVLGPLRDDPRYEELIEKINQQWGLNPDGSIPERADTSTEPQADA